MQRWIVIVALFGLDLLALGRLRPEPPGPAFTCARPAAVEHDGRQIVLCAERSPASLPELRARLGLRACPRDPPLRPGQVARLGLGCAVEVRPMPAALRLTLGLAVDVNRATADELEALPGIGPKLAARIVEDRTRRGPFPSVEALDRVRGIGPATVRRLRGLVGAEGP